MMTIRKYYLNLRPIDQNRKWDKTPITWRCPPFQTLQTTARKKVRMPWASTASWPHPKLAWGPEITTNSVWTKSFKICKEGEPTRILWWKIECSRLFQRPRSLRTLKQGGLGKIKTITEAKWVQSATSPRAHKKPSMKANILERGTRGQWLPPIPWSTSIKSRCLKPTLMSARNNTKSATIISRSSDNSFLNSKP